MTAPSTPDRLSQLVWLILVILGVFLSVVAWYRLVV
jgi:hypothetical protein